MTTELKPIFIVVYNRYPIAVFEDPDKAYDLKTKLENLEDFFNLFQDDRRYPIVTVYELLLNKIPEALS